MKALLLLALFIVLCFKSNACPEGSLVEGEFIVVTSSTPQSDSLKSFSSANQDGWSRISSSSSKVRSFSHVSSKANKIDDVYLVKGSSIEELQETSGVKSVQNNCLVESFSFDPLGASQAWYLNSIAGNINFGDPLREIVVAVTDTGFDLNHEDLVDVLWENEAELNGVPFVDDDGNGYVDDIHGYDVADDDSDPTPNAVSGADHGTHVAGLLGAAAFNTRGITGLGQNGIKVMAVKGFSSNRPTRLSDLLEAIYYSVDNGASIINASWGVEKAPEAAEITAINYALSRDVIIVAAAGNSNVPADWFVPANIPNVVTVASLNSRNQLSTFSNYGSLVEFAAPGGDGRERRDEALLSLGYNNDYVELRGTSMAAPLVTGALGLLMSRSESLTVHQALFVLSLTGRTLNLSPYLQNQVSHDYVTLNVEKAVEYLMETEESDIPNDVPDPETIEEDQSRSLASVDANGSGGGCGSLSSNNDSLTNTGNYSGFLILLCPILLVLGIRRKITRS